MRIKMYIFFLLLLSNDLIKFSSSRIFLRQLDPFKFTIRDCQTNELIREFLRLSNVRFFFANFFFFLNWVERRRIFFLRHFLLVFHISCWRGAAKDFPIDERKTKLTALIKRFLLRFSKTFKNKCVQGSSILWNYTVYRFFFFSFFGIFSRCVASRSTGI